MSNPTTIASRRGRLGFTLVELLVVIGIIALLISILLPSLAAARRQSQRTVCAAKLHNMMLAATMHRNEHLDYYPLAGLLPFCDPVGLDDAYRQKYDYYNGGVSATGQLLCPITYALATEMQGGKGLYGPNGVLGNTTYAQDTAAMLDPKGLMMNFICPAQATSPLDIQPKYVLPLGRVTIWLRVPTAELYIQRICPRLV